MKKIIKIVLAGCILIGLVFFVLIRNTSGTTPVMTLTQDVNTGQIITEQMLKVQQFSKSSIPENVVVDKKEIVNKTLSTPRLKGDFIPKDLIKKVDIELKDGEVIFSLKIPKEDTKLISEGNEIALALISDSSSDPILVKGIYVMAINSQFDQNNENEGSEDAHDLIIAKSTELIGNKIAPYLRDNNYKILVLPQEQKDKDNNKASTNTTDKNKEITDKNKTK